MPVGEGQQAGDAIVIRYGDPESYEVMVVDGGTEEAGESVVDHIRSHFGPTTAISHLVSTHPDGDHASGLRVVMKSCQVLNLWMHRPWTYTDTIAPLFKSGNWTTNGLAKAIWDSYPLIGELEALASIADTAIRDPFQGAAIGPFTVLSPALAAYLYLVPQFRRTPEPNVDELKAAGMWLERPLRLPAAPASIVEKISNWLAERWDVELLSESGVTSAENETSVVLHGDFGTSSALLTADAGVNSLSWAYNFANHNGIDLTQTNLVQVPHHGSRRNISPSVLNMVVGPKRPQGISTQRIAVVSAPKDDEVHPRRVVANAFLRRGAPVYATQGRKVRWYRNMDERPDYVPLTPLPFFDKVEADD